MLLGEPINPGGHAASGTHIELDGEVLLDDSFYLGESPRMSNNVAEYTAFIRGLEFLLKNGYQNHEVHVRGDSALVIQQVQGRWRVHGGLYVPYYRRAKVLYKNFPRMTFEWIPREKNDICDHLSKKPLIERGIRFTIQPLKPAPQPAGAEHDRWDQDRKDLD